MQNFDAICQCCWQDKERDESFKLEIVGADCDGAKIGRISKTIVTIVDDDGKHFRGILYLKIFLSCYKDVKLFEE
jgi:hypothetical protein